MAKCNNCQLGFSLLEVIFVLAVLALFAAVIGPIYRAVETKNNLDIAVASVVEGLRRAQAEAQNGRADTTWGLNITSGSETVFAGSSFASRQTTYDETLSLPGATTVSGLTQIIFNKISGLPQSTGTTTLANGFGSRQIFINAAGTLSY
jgi:prepilin-type N-terminal cleavage/methylation domain-containing protein